jgi:hypothetical protein
MNEKRAMSRIRILSIGTIAVVGLFVCAFALSAGGEQDGSELAVVSNPIGDAKAVSGGSTDYIVKSPDTITTGKPPRIVSYPYGKDNDEVSETGAKPIAPCSFVPRSEVRAILGSGVKITQEVQGPTCVYEPPDGQTVTLVVANDPVASLRQGARNASPVQIAGKTGWCMRYGSTSVGVPLSAGTMLHVTGPCAVAARLATLALPNI